MRYVVDDNGCWIWQGPTYPGGYGRASVGGKDVRAHRYFYELEYGPIPEDLVACHKCDNPPCVNPAHIFLGTREENNMDRNNKNRQARGSAINTAKLCEIDIPMIRRAYKLGITTKSLAKRYNVYESTIIRAVKYRTWKHIP